MSHIGMKCAKNGKFGTYFNCGHCLSFNILIHIQIQIKDFHYRKERQSFDF